MYSSHEHTFGTKIQAVYVPGPDTPHSARRPWAAGVLTDWQWVGRRDGGRHHGQSEWITSATDKPVVLAFDDELTLVPSEFLVDETTGAVETRAPTPPEPTLVEHSLTRDQWRYLYLLVERDSRDHELREICGVLTEAEQRRWDFVVTLCDELERFSMRSQS